MTIPLVKLIIGFSNVQQTLEQVTSNHTILLQKHQIYCQEYV